MIAVCVTVHVLAFAFGTPGKICAAEAAAASVAAAAASAAGPGAMVAIARNSSA